MIRPTRQTKIFTYRHFFRYIAECPNVASSTQQSTLQTEFKVGGILIKSVMEFKCLGQILDKKDGNLLAVPCNIKWAWQRWGMIGHIFSRKDPTPNKKYKAIVQSVLLHTSDSWVPTKSMMDSLTSFYQRCAQFIRGQHM
jgi:hypothetical protein